MKGSYFGVLATIVERTPLPYSCSHPKNTAQRVLQILVNIKTMENKYGYRGNLLYSSGSSSLPSYELSISLPPLSDILLICLPTTKYI